MFRKLKEMLKANPQSNELRKPDQLFGMIFGNEKQESSLISELQLDQRPLQAAVMRVGHGECIREILDRIVSLCAEITGSEEALAVNDGCGLAVVLFFRDTLWEDQTRSILEEIRREILEKWPGGHIYISLGTVEESKFTGDPSWKKSFKTALGLLDYRYVKPAGKLIAYTDIINRRKIYPPGIDFRFDLLKNHLEDESSDGLLKWLGEIDSALQGEKLTSTSLLFHLVLEIIVNTVSLFREKNLIAETYIGPPEDLIFAVLQHNTRESLHDWVREFLLKSHSCLKSITPTD